MKDRRIRNLIATLWSDRQGNVLPIVAAAIIPLLAIVGGGVDASRGYLTKTQLQNACDAGVLAGRRAMAKTGVYETTERAKATRMFDANFDAAIVEAQEVSFVTRSGDEGKVFGTASTRIPTVLMKIFGQEEMSFSVDCMAELQITNSDVMFVLDTTGSMGGSRIVGLRQAVKDFHTTITSSVTDEDVRIRYGFVPYAMTVNAKRLLTTGQMPMDYIANQAPYQSRMAVFNTPAYIASGSSTQDSIETHSGWLSSWQCNNYGNNYGSNPVDSGSAPGTTTRTSYSYHSRSGGTCRRNVRVVSTSYDTVYQFSYWRYDQSTLDVSGLKSLGSVQFASGVAGNGYVPTAGMYDIRTLAVMPGTSGISRSGYTWDGCIEERDTVVDLDMNPVPSGATDLDINSAPNSDDTRWKPHFSNVVFYRYDYLDGVNSTTDLSSVNNSCPAQMRMLEEVDLTPNTIPGWLNTYLDELIPGGNTYHDIGMIWGARLGSPSGMFSHIVDDEPNRPVSRHIIFMTDGVMQPNRELYTAYGIERYDNRIAPRNTGNGTLAEYHNSRFVAACDAAKDEGYTVWVIGFGSSLTDEMRACATGHRAYFSNDNEELSATFRFIASQVADLRLGQ